jgi:hypothetical protein
MYVAPIIGTKITEERFMMDEPSGVRNDQTETSVDGAQALAFHGFDAVMGQTYVVYQRRFSLRSLHIQRARTWAQRNNVHLAIYINP